MTTTQEKTIVLGDEYDERLRAVVLGVLEQLGVGAALHEHGFGGLRELETLTVEIGDERLVVEAETYVGLSVRGDAALVEKVESMVRERLGSA